MLPLSPFASSFPLLLLLSRLAASVNAQAALTFLPSSGTSSEYYSSFHNCPPSVAPPGASDELFNISAVYAQLDPYYGTLDPDQGGGGPGGPPYGLRLVSVGVTGSQQTGESNNTDGTNYLVTLQLDSSLLSFSLFSNNSKFCQAVRNPTTSTIPGGTDNATAITNSTGSGCPYGPGDVAFGAVIPLQSSYALGTVWTQVRITDTNHPPNYLACYTLGVTPYYPDKWYFDLFLYLPIALAASYLFLALSSRAITSLTSRSRAFRNRAREGSGPTLWRDTIGPTVLGAISGEQLVASPGLLRFATPGAWDVIFHTQWVLLIASVSVSWPEFVYPFFRQAAWASLLENVTLVQGAQASSDRYSTLQTNFTPPPLFANQISDPTSPLYLNPQVPSQLLHLSSAQPGLESVAAIIGLRKQDLFGTAMAVWLIIVAAVLVISAVAWTADLIGDAIRGAKGRREVGGSGEGLPKSLAAIAAGPTSGRAGSTVHGSGVHSKGSTAGTDLLQPSVQAHPASPVRDRADGPDGDGDESDDIDNGRTRLGSLWFPQWRARRAARRGAYRSAALSGPSVAVTFSSSTDTHMRAMAGNLTRCLVLFHLPIVLLSTYQLSLATTVTTKLSVALAALSLAFLGVLIPAFLIWRLSRTPSNRLYDSVRTLLVFGPLYNTYAPGSQLFGLVSLSYDVVIGIVIGALQKYGLAQSIVLLAFEIGMTLATSLWLPWGEGANMGPVSFGICVCKIITAVLVLLLAPALGIGTTGAGWIAYVVLLVQGIVYVFFLLLLFFKVIEGLVRLFGRVPFDERISPRVAGLGGAIRGIKKRQEQQHRNNGGGRASREALNRSGSVNTQTLMLRDVGRSPSGGIPTGSAVNTPGGTVSHAPISHSRQTSFTSYLNDPMYRNPLDMAASGPYSAYLRSDDHDEGFIMAALPPTAPGWGNHGGYMPVHQGGPPSPPPRGPSPWGAGPGDAPIGRSTTPSSPKAGFVRVGGGRATDASPYSPTSSAARRSPGAFYRSNIPLPGPPDPNRRIRQHAHSASAGSLGIIPFNRPDSPHVASRSVVPGPRPRSQTAIIEFFPSGSPQRSPEMNPQRYSGGQVLSPAVSAPLATGAQGDVQQEDVGGGGKGKGKGKNKGWFGLAKSVRKDSADSWTDDDEDEDDGDGVWGDNGKNRRWTWTFGKLAAGLGIRGKGRDEDGKEEEGEEGIGTTTAPPAGGKSFVVVRNRMPARRAASEDLQSRSSAAGPSGNRPPTVGSADTRDRGRDGVAKQPASRVDSTTLGIQVVELPTQPSGAEMTGQTASSAPAPAAAPEEDPEARFWLPDATVQARRGGEGVLTPEERQSASATPSIEGRKLI